MPPFATDQERKIFIGGLNSETTETSLQEYFSRWGECIDVVVMRHSDTGKPRGFGFVTYKNVESVDAVLSVHSHVLDGKKIDPKRSVAREEGSTSSTTVLKQEAQNVGQNTERSLHVDNDNRVFVGGLPGATTEENVRECFTKFCCDTGYGMVEHVEIMKNRIDGQCRGFCFVTFNGNTDIIDKVCAEKYFQILNKTVEVRRAESKQAMTERKMRGNDFYRRRISDHRRYTNNTYQGPANMISNNYHSGTQGSMPDSFISGDHRGFNGFNMNAMAQFAGMMSMFASYMAMSASASMGNFGTNQMQNMADAMGNLLGNGMGCQNHAGGNLSLSNRGYQTGNMTSDMTNFGTFQGRNVDGAIGGNPMSGQSCVGGDLSSSSSTGQQSNSYPSEIVNTSYPTTSNSPAVSTQNSTTYYQQEPSGDMSSYAKIMSAMFGVNPGNVQAALYNSYYGTSGDTSHFGVYDNQSTSMYGPTRNASTGDSAQGYKPY